MPASRPSAWAALWSTITKVQSSKLSPWLALRNTVGVTVPLAVGVIIHQQLGGISVATGALNACFSDGQEPYRQRGKRMLAASLLVGIAVLAGELCGHRKESAVIVAVVWAFAAGMLVSLSTQATDVGHISLVTMLVYMGSPQSLDRAIYSGLLAFSGGLLQTALYIALYRWRRYAPD